jgi:aspartyl-tRNA synthetase
MMSGLDRYYQLCRCFRDEDLRADRQPEFTQIDIEMAFITEADIFQVVEGMIAAIFDQTIGVQVKRPFPRLTFQESMARFGLELTEVSHIVKDSDFRTFKEVVDKGGMVKALCAPGLARLSRKELDDLIDFAGVYGAKGLAWVKLTGNGWQSPLAKYFPDGVKQALTEHLGAQEGDIFFFVADDPEVANTALGQLRLHLGHREGLIPEDTFNLVWVTDFPLLEFKPQENRYEAMHHPFTAPMDEDIPYLDSAPARVRARAYDLVLNGQEIGGGSIRNYRRDVQEQVFRVLGLKPREVEEKFGFLVEALDYGAPPHGGVAFGFDRLVAILCGLKSIREVIAFPKTQKAACLLTRAPSPVDAEQLLELGLRLEK